MPFFALGEKCVCRHAGVVFEAFFEEILLFHFGVLRRVLERGVSAKQ
jgi:hypothetical protein